MKGKVVSVANLKGGVGKTTTAIMLAEGLSLQEAPGGGRRNRVLVIDSDPQASLGFALAGVTTIKKVADAHNSVNSLLMKAAMHEVGIDVGAAIVPNIARVHGAYAGKMSKTDISLLASSPAMIYMEQLLIRDLTKRKMSYEDSVKCVFDVVDEKILKYARKNFDWTIIDCAPGMNLLTRTSICASDATVVTAVPEPMSTFGFDLFLNSVWTDQLGILPNPRLPLVLLTRVRASQVGTKIEISRIERAIDATPPFKLLKARIPEVAALDGQWFLKYALMSLAGRYKSALAKIVEELAIEIGEIVHDARRI